MADIIENRSSGSKETIDWVLILLFAGVFISAALVFVVEKWWQSDGQLFQVIAGLLSAFTGSFFTRLKPRDATDKGGVTVTSTSPSTISASISTPPTQPAEPPV